MSDLHARLPQAVEQGKALAWHGDAALKAEVLARMLDHRVEDSIVQGVYQQLDPSLYTGYRGCAIGCTLPRQPHKDGPDGGWHRGVERLYAIPASIGYLIDRIFENVTCDQASPFAVAVIEAVPVGADLSLVTSQFLLDVLSDPVYGALQATAERSDAVAVTRAVIGLYERRLAGDEPTREEWVRARRAAAAAATAAAYDTATAAAAYDTAYDVTAAAAAAYDTAYDVTAAADAAHDAAGTGDTAMLGEWWTWAAERLLDHLRNAPQNRSSAGVALTC